ncbi:hypothetical protein GCM10010466_03020 [Planomonospora alba]|uniref:Transposase putative helix-turn-helix domain-containing protein n=1 Tax=Planomonospora alba TaxID=161354 RepID=A0ABP6MIB7_9ACTN
MSDRQGFRIELDPTPDQRARLGRHAGLSRVVGNFCLEKVRAALDQRQAEKTYGATGQGPDPGALVGPRTGAGLACRAPSAVPMVHR